MPKLKDPNRPPLEHLTLFFHKPALRYVKAKWKANNFRNHKFSRWLVIQMFLRFHKLLYNIADEIFFPPRRLISHFRPGTPLVKVSVRIDPKDLKIAREVWNGEIDSGNFWGGFGLWMAAHCVINVAMNDILKMRELRRLLG